ncbi:hypothetical protein DSECCO2_39040 [anaerobic digester metagenome]
MTIPYKPNTVSKNIKKYKYRIRALEIDWYSCATAVYLDYVILKLIYGDSYLFQLSPQTGTDYLHHY